MFYRCHRRYHMPPFDSIFNYTDDILFWNLPFMTDKLLLQIPHIPLFQYFEHEAKQDLYFLLDWISLLFLFPNREIHIHFNHC